MKILYYDCFSGISGDMNLGAMLDLGVSRDILESGLQKLNLKGWRLDITRDQRHGITGTRVSVLPDGLEENVHDHAHDHEDEHTHEHTHEHDPGEVHGHSHEHESGHSHEHAPGQGHPHRNLEDIRKIISTSDLSSSVKELSMKIFRKIAEA